MLTKPEASLSSLYTREVDTMASAVVNLMDPLMHWIKQEEHNRAYFRWKCPLCYINDDDLRGSLKLFDHGTYLFSQLYKDSCEHEAVPNAVKYVRELNYLIKHYQMQPLPEDRHDVGVVDRNASQYRDNAGVYLNKKAR